MQAGTFGAFGLLELAADLAQQGAVGAATDALDRAARLDDVGLVATACRALADELTRGGPKRPTTDELQAAFSAGGSALHDGRRPEALDRFLFVVTHDPRAARAWFGVGCAHRNTVEATEAAAETSVDATTGPVLALLVRPYGTIAQDAYIGMVYAAEAFRIAIALEPTLSLATDALVWAELWLGRSEQGLRLATDAAERQPGDSNAVATLAVALLVCGHADEARQAAEAAVGLEPAHSTALETIAIAEALARAATDPVR